MCCEPRFLTAANNDAEARDAYFQALVNVPVDPDRCDWVQYEKDTSSPMIQGRDWADPQWASDYRIAAQGTLNIP